MLDAETPHALADPNSRTEAEERVWARAKDSLVVGFCVAGYIMANRDPAAVEVIFDPSSTSAPAPAPLGFGHSYWGVPAFINRLGRYRLVHPTTVPIREAVDFTHACILSTIKAIKFSQLPPVCGGPIEIAVITTDRPFRWVMHKNWDAAIREGSQQ